MRICCSFKVKIIFIFVSFVILFLHNPSQVYLYFLYTICHEEGTPSTVAISPQNSSPEKKALDFFLY